MNEFTKLIIAILATWRISRLFIYESGPFDIFAKIRYYAGVRYNEYSQPVGTGIFASLFNCLWCISIWIACVIAYMLYPNTIGDYFLLIFALSAGAILIDETMNCLTNNSLR